ncbi:MAG TPA: GAF domain-containing protein [Croceibacterium sp.]|nr:GAF domain-containing protein [Croceibacterium sp.]
MYAFTADPARPKSAFYDDLVRAADALTTGESDGIANMANVAALMWQLVPDLNWAGFYRVIDRELVLGPFCGKPACIRIPLGQGVCGTAAASGESQLVPDVRAFNGHIACDADSRSELVVPVRRGGTIIAVIDLDAPRENRFDTDDLAGIERLAQTLADRL